MEHRVTVSLQIARHVTHTHTRAHKQALIGFTKYIFPSKNGGSGFAVLSRLFLFFFVRHRAEFSSFKYFFLTIRLFNSFGCDFCSLH